mgnify:CR=1 FL=1
MSAHNILGKAGEDAAAKYLEQNGYTIRDRNWRKNFMFYVRRSYLFIGLIMKGEPGLVSGTW